jgi:hypothetical protein
MMDRTSALSGESLRVHGRPDTMVSIVSGGPGTSFPLGATIRPGGTNFSVFAKHATSVQLLLFDSPEAGPSSVISIGG